MMVMAQYRRKLERRRARKETEARKAMAKESLAKVWESTTKAMSTAKITITAKAVRKEKNKGIKVKEGNKGKGTGQGKDEKPAPNSSFSKALAGHVANGDTRRVSVGKDTCKLWREFPVLLRVQ